MEEISSITMPTPDDMHLHVRQGEALKAVVPQTANQFARAIIMPNTTPPTTTTAMAARYLEEVLAGVSEGFAFTPLMTLYLTGATTPEMIREAKASGFIYGMKFYPAGATTNSEAGVADIRSIAHVLMAMQEIDLPLLVHGETADPLVDVFDREDRFVGEYSFASQYEYSPTKWSSRSNTSTSGSAVSPCTRSGRSTSCIASSRCATDLMSETPACELVVAPAG